MNIYLLIVDEPSLNGRSRLVIRNAMKNADGTYMCVAENPAGIRRAIAAVRVKGELINSHRELQPRLKYKLIHGPSLLQEWPHHCM
jgi:hypothetical protein